MTQRVVHSLGVTLLSGLVLFGVGCSSTLPAGTASPEPQVQAMPPIRDRGLELATLRTELAATKIAAAKKEAELIELRDLVKQLRLEYAESRQAFLELRDQTEQQQRTLERAREEQQHQAQAHDSQDLSILKDTVVTLAQELGQLRQDLAKPLAKELVKSTNPGSSTSPESGPHALRSAPPQRVPVARQQSSPLSAMSPVALTVTSAVAPGPPSTITVQSGDTLASLAKRHRTTIEVLRKLNVLEGDTVIVGRELVLPTTQ
jgi:LysM repeat protein